MHSLFGISGTLNKVYLGLVNVLMNFPREKNVLHDMVRHTAKASLGQGCSASHGMIVSCPPIHLGVDIIQEKLKDEGFGLL